MKRFILALLLAAVFVSPCLAYPVVIQNGDRSITFEKSPERVITNCDSNIIELLFALNLDDRLIGYAGFPEYHNNVSPEYRERLAKIPVITPGYITLEPLLNANPDFFLSGYNYGLDVPSAGVTDAITPDELEKHGIKSYAITESLIRIMKKPVVSLEDTYTDIRNLGRIFNVEERAEKVIADMKTRVSAVEEKIGSLNIDKPLEVFIYQTWNAHDQPPRTPGGQAMPSALLKLVKAHNVFSDIDDSWVKTTWEDVIERNPDVILISETGNTSGEERKEIIMNDPVLQGIKAVKDGRIYIIRVEETYPGPRAVHGLEEIAKMFYPELF